MSLTKLTPQEQKEDEGVYKSMLDLANLALKNAKNCQAKALYNLLAAKEKLAKIKQPELAARGHYELSDKVADVVGLFRDKCGCKL